MEIKQNIRADALKLGSGQHKVNCPFCSSQRKKRDQKTLSLKVDSDVVVYNCWHCNENGSVRFEDNNFKIIRRENVVHAVDKNRWRDLTTENGSITYLNSRGISEDTARNVGINIITLHQKKKRCLVLFFLTRIRAVQSLQRLGLSQTRVFLHKVQQ